MTDPSTHAQITITEMGNGSVQYDIIPHDKTEEGAMVLLDKTEFYRRVMKMVNTSRLPGPKILIFTIMSNLMERCQLFLCLMRKNLKMWKMGSALPCIGMRIML